MGSANQYYEAGEGRPVQVKALFSKIAHRYDFLNDLQSFGLHRLWKRRLVKLAAPQPGQRALDVCCGTGDIALSLAGVGADVVGLDFTPAMLAIAERRAHELSARGQTCNLKLVEGDAQKLPFPDNTFDIVTVGYGLRNLADWKLGLREMWRVARPGGKLLILDFAKPDNPAWRSVYFGYLKCLVPLFGKCFCGDPQAYSYILESLHHYPAQHGVAKQLLALGCENTKLITLLAGVMSINCGTKRRP